MSWAQLARHIARYSLSLREYIWWSGLACSIYSTHKDDQDWAHNADNSARENLASKLAGRL